MMANVVCRDGNWLVNVGPDKNGKLSPEIMSRMREVGAWLKQNGESVYKTRGGPVEPGDGVFGTTFRGREIFVHILDAKAFTGLALPDYTVISCATLDGAPVPFTQQSGEVSVALPENLPAAPDTILRLTVDRDIPAPPDQRVRFTGEQ
jgi:alpha-L-fucosidase